MTSIYLSLSAKVAISTFFMKYELFLVPPPVWRMNRWTIEYLPRGASEDLNTIPMDAGDYAVGAAS